MRFTIEQGGGFEIPDEWWKEAGMVGFVPRTLTYAAAPAPYGTPAIVPLLDIEPPRRAEGVRWFDRERMTSILRGFVSGTLLPPIEVNETPTGPYRYRLHNGFHRFYASIAAGFTHLPVEINPSPDL